MQQPRPTKEFWDLCIKLVGTKSYKEKEALLQPYQSNSQIRDLFKLLVDPNERILTSPPYAVGVGPATLNKVWPDLIQPFHVMMYDKAHFGPGESWLTLVHYLDDYKNWVVSPDPLGIRALIIVNDQSVKPRSDRIRNIVNFSEIEKAVLEVFGGSNVTLDGRLSSERRITKEDVYADYVDPQNSEKEQLSYYCFDVVDGKMFEDRYSFIRDREDTKHLKFVKCEPIDYTTTKQLQRFSDDGYFKVLLRYTRSMYNYGLSRNMLSLTI